MVHATVRAAAIPHGRDPPSQIGVADDELQAFVGGVAEATGEFLQIVNLNLKGSQYAIAGTVRARGGRREIGHPP